jgi:hypothetical protein
MKLILCKNCSDVFKLDNELRTCKCKKSFGLYITDIYAEYNGEFAIPLGIVNSDLKTAIYNQPNEGLGERFDAFVIPKNCETCVKIT